VADYFTSFSFEFEALKEEAEDFKKVIEYDFDRDEDDFDPWEVQSISREDFIEKVDPYGNGLFGFGVVVLVEDHDQASKLAKVTVHDDAGSPTLDQLIDTVKVMFKHTTEKEPIVIEWASTCSKPRTDGFGGGVSVIQNGKDTTINTAEMAQLLAKIRTYVHD